MVPHDVFTFLNLLLLLLLLLLWQVEDDRAQINAVIQQLDEKKREALKETWKQVWLASSTFEQKGQTESAHSHAAESSFWCTTRCQRDAQKLDDQQLGLSPCFAGDFNAIFSTLLPGTLSA
jgi:hypothetical protein